MNLTRGSRENSITRMIFLVVWAILACLPVVGWTENFYWSGSVSQDWGTGGNWDPVGVPAAETDIAYLYQGGDSILVAEYRNTFSPTPRLGGVFINSSPNGSMTLLIQQSGPAGELWANTVSVGDKNLGQVLQTGGTLTVSENLYLGDPLGSTGNYTLQLNGLVTTKNTIVGNEGTGSFDQSGGSHTVTQDLTLGRDSNGQGSYSLAGTGILTTANTSVGSNGTGAFQQTGGTHTAGNVLVLGEGTGSQGAYRLENGQLTTNYTLVGIQGSGGFVQLGGTHIVNLGMGIAGVVSTSQGSYELQNGSLIIGDSTRSTAGFLNIGESGAGTFFQSGGLVQVTGTVNLGVDAGSQGQYDLTGGTLNVIGIPSEPEIFRSTVTFSEISSLSTPRLDVGLAGIGTFNQGSGSFLTIGSEEIPGILGVNSQTGLSTFNQYGGDTTVYGTMEVGQVGQGAYYLGGGTLTTRGPLNLGSGGTGTFTQDGGTHTVPQINVGLGGTGIYNLQGGSLNPGGSQVGDVIVGSPGSSFNQSGSASARFGTVTVVNGLYDLSGGSLEADNIRVGEGGTGTFQQSGDSTVTINQALHLGIRPGDTGTYTLHGGTMSFAPREEIGETIFLGIGGVGTFNQFGGTVVYPGGSLRLGVESSGLGTYNLLGGQLQIGTIELADTGGETHGTGIFYLAEEGTLNAETINLNPGGTFQQTGGSLNYTTFRHQGGEVQGELENRGTYNYLSGLCSGRLLNYGSGTVNFESDFTAANGMAHHSSNPVTLKDPDLGEGEEEVQIRRLTFNGAGLEVDQNAVFNQTGGILTTTDTIIGNTGIGTFNHSGGSHTVENPSSLILGNEQGSTGKYNLQSSGILKTNNTIVGNSGTGIFKQTGGTHTVSNALVLGEGPDSQGSTYRLENGELTTNYTLVGINGHGSFEQIGGTHTATMGIGLAGAVNTSRGDYDLQNGVLIVTGVPATQSGGFLDIGESGEGTFSQSGGLVRVTGTTTLGVYQGSWGTYTITDGSLEVLNEPRPPEAPGIEGNMFVGDNGVGRFTQSGSNTAVTVDNHLGIGRGQDGDGQYDLNGGTLTTGYLFVGNQGTGVFNHQAALHTITGSGYVGSDTTGTGTYNLKNGATLRVTESFDVGSTGFGTFNQSAGSTFTTGNLFVGDSPARLNQSGQLQDGGTFNQDGGNTTVLGHLGVGRSRVGQGTYNLRDGNLNVGDPLDPGNVGDLFIGYEGTGTFRQTGGVHTVTGTMYVGYENTGVGAYYLENGTLSGTNAQVGIGGSGSLVQSGGTMTLSQDLTLGVNPTASGKFSLEGGAATMRDIYLNTGGTFHQNGGTLKFTTFYHQGGEVQGNLENRSAYIYSGGTFNGRLLNYGTVEFNNNFTAANGMAHYSATPYSLADTNRTLTFNGAGLEVGNGATFNLEAGTVKLGDASGNSLTIRKGGTFNQRGGIVDGSSNTLIIAEGTCTLSNGTLRPGNTMYVRPGGFFSQTGGIVDGASNTLFIAEGDCTLADGTLRPGNRMNILPGGSFTQTGGLVDGFSNTMLITEGTFDLRDGTIRPGNAMEIRNRGSFTQTGGLVDGSSNTISIFEGRCTVDGGRYEAGTLILYSGGQFYWNSGEFSYNTLNLQGGKFYGNLNNQGVISGTGTIIGNVINQGTVSPGNSVGVVTIVGDFTQTPRGTCKLEIASAGSYDRIRATGNPGTATVAGTLQPELLPGFTPVWNQVFPGIITAENGIAGDFDTINSSLPWLVQYNAARTSMNLRVGGFDFNYANFALTANQRNVGIMFNQVAASAAGDLGAALSNIALLPAGSVGNAYQQISPDKASALPALSLAGSMMQWQSVANRLSYQRWTRGGMPNLAGGRSGAMNLSYNSLAGLMLAYNGADLTGMTGSRRPPADGTGTWGLFTDFVSAFGSQDSTANITGYNFSIFGFNLGGDYRLRDDLVIGLGTGFSTTSASYKGSGGNAGINSVPVYAYGAYTPGSFYAMGYLGYTFNFYNLDRNIAFGAINRTATGAVDGNQLNVSLETGYDFRLAQFTVTPAASLYYSQAWVGGFTESGAGALSLNVDSQSADSLQTGLGVRLSRPFQSGQTLILPQLYAFYQHEFANDSRGLDARLARTGTSFGFQTESPSRDFAVLGAGLAVGLKKNLTLQANYNAEVGRKGYTPHVVSAGLRYEF